MDLVFDGELEELDECLIIDEVTVEGFGCVVGGVECGAGGWVEEDLSGSAGGVVLMEIVVESRIALWLELSKHTDGKVAVI